MRLTKPFAMQQRLFTCFLGLLYLMLASCDGCTKKQQLSLPTVDQVPPGQRLDIDGLYVVEVVSPVGETIKWLRGNQDSTTNRSKVRIEKGRVICVEDAAISSGVVFTKNLRKTDQYHYRGTRLISTGDNGFYETGTTLLKVENGGLIETIEERKDKPFWQKPVVNSMRYYLVELSREPASKVRPKPKPRQREGSGSNSDSGNAPPAGQVEEH